jgi:hypothetical protein
MIDQHSPASQFGRHSPVSVLSMVFQSDPLNLGSYLHLFVTTVLRTQMPVKPCLAYTRKMAHPLDTQTALQ